MSLYPVNLKITDRLCVIVGGGRVAFRKAKGLLDGGACLRVISPFLRKELIGLSEKGDLEWIQREFADGDLKGAFLVFAATNNRDVQERVMKEARNYSVLISSGDDPVGSDFHVPAHFRRGRMLVTVSTGGGSPALASKIREQLETVVVVEYEAVVDLLSLIREQLLGVSDNPTLHREIFQNLLGQDLVDLVLEEKWFDLQMMLLKVLPKDFDSVELMRQFIEQHDQRER